MLKATLGALGILCCSIAISCGGSDGGGGDKPATEFEIRNCQQACDQQKTFDCYDARAHATCYANCQQASSDDIAAFTGCVRADLCDAACALEIKPDMPPPASACVSECKEFIADGCAPQADCESACAELVEEERSLAVYCLSTRTQCTMRDGCPGVGEDPVAACKSSCDDLASFSCISAADQANCRNLCGTVDAAKRDNFTACADSGICKDDSCYRVLTGQPPGPDVAGCQTACDKELQFGCIDAPTQAACRTKCETATRSPIETFKGCAGRGATCSDGSCTSTFLASP